MGINSVSRLDYAQFRRPSLRDPALSPERLPFPTAVLIAVLLSLGLWSAIWWTISSLAAAL